MLHTIGPLVLIAAATSAGSLLAAEMRPLLLVDGSRTRAALTGATADGRWTFNDDSGATRAVSASEVVIWGNPAEVALGPVLWLIDGGVIAQSPAEPGQPPASLQFDKDLLQLDRSPLGPLTLPLELLRGVVFDPPSNRSRRDRMLFALFGAADSAAPPRDADRVVLVNGDALDGTLQSCDGSQVVLAAPAGKTSIDRSKVAALLYNPSLSPKLRRQGLAMLIGLRDGTRIAAKSFVLSDHEIVITPALAIDGHATWTAPRDMLVFLQPLGGKITYLSDLQADSYKHLPYLSLTWPYRNDLSVTGAPLRAGGRMFAKGIGMHSAARLTYRLDKPYKRFEADVAIDDETAGQGSATVRVFVDSQQVWASTEIRGGAAPEQVRVDLPEGERLSLLVDFGQRGDELDHVDWLNARLVE